MTDKVQIRFGASKSPYIAGDVAWFDPTKASKFVQGGFASYVNEGDVPGHIQDKDGNVLPKWNRPHSMHGTDMMPVGLREPENDTRLKQQQPDPNAPEPGHVGTDRNQMDMHRRQGADDGARGETPGMGAEGFGPGAVGPSADQVKVGGKDSDFTAKDVTHGTQIGGIATGEDVKGRVSVTADTDPDTKGKVKAEDTDPEALGKETVDTDPNDADDTGFTGDDGADNGDSGDSGTKTRKKGRTRL